MPTLKSVAKLKSLYLADQTKLAAQFEKFPELSAARIQEAQRVVNLPNEEFLDYVHDWTCISH